MGILILLFVSLAFGQQSTTRLNVVYNGSTEGRIRGYEQDRGNYIDLIWPSSMAANYTQTMPKSTGTLLSTVNYHYHDSQALSWSAWRARGTEASPTDLIAGDSIVQITALGMQSSTWVAFANMAMGYGGTNQGYIDFSTRNASGYGPRINISSDGHIWPYGSSTQDIGFSSGRFRKGWFADIDVSGVCTGCGGAPPITWTLETNNDILTMQHHLSSGTVARNILSQYSRGTNASPSAAAASDTVWSEKWQYYAGGAYRDAGAIFVNVPAGSTVSGTSSPGQVSIFGTKHSETAGTEVVRLGAQTFSETPNWGAKWFASMWPSGNLTLDLGAAGAEWLTVWASRIRTTGTTDITFYPGNTSRWAMQYADGTMLPTVDTGPKIGSKTQRVHSTWAAAYNSYTHNSWGTQTNSWTADQSLYHQLNSYGLSYINAVEMRKARGTEASPTAVSNADIIGYSLYEGYSPSGSFAFSAYIKAYVDGTPSGSTVPGAVSIGTLNASGSLADRFIVRADGTIEIPGNLTVTGTCTGCGSGATPPVDWYLNSGSTPLTLANHGTVSASQLVSRFSRGTNASPTDAALNDLVGNHTFRYYAGGAYRDAAAIWVGTPASGVTISSSSSPAFLAIFATADGATSGSEVMRFGALGGSLGFGTMTGQKVIPSSNLAVDLGAFGAEWLTVWASRIRTSSTTAIDFYPGNTHRWTMTTGAGSLSPITDGGPSIGSEPNKANQVWARSFRSYTDSSYGTQQHDLYGDANLNLILTTFSSASASDRASIQMHRYRGSKNSPSAVQALDQLGVIAFDGLSASGLGVGATIRAYATLVGSGFVSADLHFQTTNTSGTLNTPFILRDSGEADFFYAVDAVSGFKFNGTSGVTATIPVRKADDSGSCNIVVQGGIITSTTC